MKDRLDRHTDYGRNAQVLSVRLSEKLNFVYGVVSEELASCHSSRS